MKQSALVPSAPPPEPGVTYRFTAPNLASTPKAARLWVVSLLSTFGRDLLVEAAELCTSEVVTNAHLHTNSPRITVEVTLTPTRVVVFVCDSAPGSRPSLVPPELADLDTHGRGLALVEQYATSWSVLVGEDSKAVWFSLVGGRCAA
ncbi:ATP-binding protein [Streptomyces sp. NPDC002073]